MLRGICCILCIAGAALAAIGPNADATAQPRMHNATAGEAEVRAYPLPFHYDLYTFRGDGGSTTVVASFAVPAGRLESEDVAYGVRYRFDVSLVLADTALRSVFRTDDSVYVGFTRPLAREHLLYTQLEVQARPSRSTVQRVIVTDATRPGVGQLYDAAFPIPDYSGAGLMVSDIALGQPEATAGWKRGDITLALLPTSLFPTSAFDVYYEIYNLPAGRHYVTEIAVARADELAGLWSGDRAAVRLRFSDESFARDGVVPELRRVDTSLGRGRYRITVRVTDEETGASASASRYFDVRGWERGTTLVPAWPRARGSGVRARASGRSYVVR
ncbi:MAG TPA: hypothetical protein VMN60_09190 [Longimicrobiales bacterium]|nr:hypothetical protein [Longimicrobiales bacterium]